MSGILRRELAPISDRAWEQIDAEAGRILRHYLVGRKVVDFSGPQGWELGAVNLGRLGPTDNETPQGVRWAVRQNLPLTEIRVPFTLSQMEIDDVTRGSADMDLDALQQAAAKAARFEDAAVFKGFDEGCIKGMLASSGHEPVSLPDEASGYPTALAEAVGLLAASGIGGPYAVVLSADRYAALAGAAKTGYPPYRTVKEIARGGVLPGDVLDGGAVVSTRGGDFELVVGVDFSVGFEGADGQNVNLFVTESFAFRVLEPRAAVELKPPA